jgi:hypothetical protein
MIRYRARINISLGHNPILLFRPTHHDPGRTIWQRPLQRLRLIPERASSHRAILRWDAPFLQRLDSVDLLN